MKSNLFIALIITVYSCTPPPVLKNYGAGISIDPGIEDVCKYKKDSLNNFNIDNYENDSTSKNPMLNVASILPLIPIVKFSREDTTITFANFLTTSGFGIKFINGKTEITYFQSSRSCRCFKDSLSQKEMEYGGNAIPENLTLVLSKRNGIKKNDVIYGYLDISGGGYYQQVSSGSTQFKKRSASYYGYFKIEMKDIQNALEDFLKKTN